MIRLLEKYKKEVMPAMEERFGYRNVMAVPKIEKVIVNTGFGKLLTGKTTDEKKRIYKSILNDLSLICGQFPVLTKARKSISGFKIRKDMPVGAKVTLRGQRMYDFLERVIYIALPRTRDFRGIKLKSVDNAGNLTIAVKEHIIFPEIEPENVKVPFGLEITVVTTAKSKEEGLKLLRLLGFPIQT